MAEVSRDARLLYIGLWCFMDRQGLCEDNAKLIKRNVFPYDDDISQDKIERLVESLAVGKFLYRFQYDEMSLLLCPQFALHQKFHPGEKLMFKVPDASLPTYKQPASNLLAVKKCAGTGIGIGTGTGIGIGTGIGTGTGTGCAAKLEETNVSDQEIRDLNQKLLMKRESMGLNKLQGFNKA